MKRITSLLVCLAFIALSVNAQDIQITGKVTSSEDGNILPGVSVVVKGTTTGTTTSVDGEYSIKAPSDGSLIFSFVGMTSIEVGIGGRTTINVELNPDAIAVGEVVVTALGISREKKSLGYAVQEVNGEDLNAAKTTNFVTSLSGRVAGVHVKNNTNFAGSNNVIIRGSSSLTGNNQALFVVDGIPISNANTNNTGQTTGRSGYDFGNAANDINSSDIESITVLKGAAATALYGSRAANGVVLITTKKGTNSVGGSNVGVNFNSNVTFGVMDKSTFPKYQDKYGAGYDQEWYSHSVYFGMDGDDVTGDGNEDILVPYYEDASRGQAFASNISAYQYNAFIPESPHFGQATPYQAGANGPETFFETAVSYTNSIDVTGGSDKTTYRFSYTNMNATGIMPNSSLKRNNFLFNGSYNIVDNLKVSASANYINTNGLGRPSTGYSDNIMSSFRQWYQVNVDIQEQKELYEATGQNATWNPVSWDDRTPIYWDNPYWVRYENYETDVRDRLIGYAQADWQITSYLSAMGRFAIDSYTELQEERKAVGSVAGELGVDRPDVTSGYSRYQRTFMETNMDFMLNFHKSFGDIDVSALLGTNIRRSAADRIFASTNGGLAVPELFALNNSVDPMLPPQEKLEEIGVNGIFGSVNLGFKDFLFVDATLRRDQSSTLPEENNAYFYPSVTGSIVFSELIDAFWLSLGKLRLNYAEVGNDAPALSVKDTYRGVAPFSGNSLVTNYFAKNNEDLLPERQKSLEGGLEVMLLNNRLGFDLALYKSNTFNQLMPVSVSQITGYRDKWVNAGELENKGVELVLYGTPVLSGDFKWNITLNWAKNANKVVSLFVDEAGNEVKNLQLASLQGGITINARVGEAYGSINGSDYTYHDNGGKIVDEDGYYVKSATNDIVLGNFNPDWTGGVRNAFSYKAFDFSFLIDWQKGGDIFSLDLWYGIGTGLYEETADNNDLGNQERLPLDQGGGIILDGVNEDGTPNVTRIPSDIFAEGWVSSPNKRFVYDASYVKLREVVLTYNLPSSLMQKTFIAGASLSFVGSNLWIIKKNLPHADPEATQGSGNIQGWQSGVMPATKNYGFSLNLQF
jgi:TonB-linked SusC/RagA family outer membrane protein